LRWQTIRELKTFFVVEDASGAEIDEDQGEQPLSSVGNLSITPEAVGAQEEEEASEDETP